MLHRGSPAWGKAASHPGCDGAPFDRPGGVLRHAGSRRRDRARVSGAVPPCRVRGPPDGAISAGARRDTADGTARRVVRTALGIHGLNGDTARPPHRRYGIRHQNRGSRWNPRELLPPARYREAFIDTGNL